MTKLLMTLTISVVASILVISALIASPDAYSDKNHDVLDECKCEKPDTLKVHLTVPDGEKGTEFRIDIFKKLDDRDDLEKRLLPIPAFVGDADLTISAISFAKDKLESNTAFVVYEVDGAPDLSEDAEPGARVDKEVALMEIHTSCSKPLFIDMTVFDVNDPGNGYSLEVLDGLKETERSIPEFEPNSCEDEKKKSTGSITIKKALTNDNGGTAKFEDFTITVTNVETPEETITVDIDPLLGMGVKDVPAGTYTLNESHPTDKGPYTTVLIAGDTGCPSMLDEVFTIKKDKNLSCTIYNDDDSDGLERFVFQNKSLQIDFNDHTTDDSCKLIDSPSPCIEIFGFDEGDIAIVDPKLVSTTTIILFSVFETEPTESLMAVETLCAVSQIISHKHLPGADPSDDTLSVVISCAGFDTNKAYHVNYVMIDPRIT